MNYGGAGESEPKSKPTLSKFEENINFESSPEESASEDPKESSGKSFIA